MRRPVLVTRPMAQGKALCELLAKRGFEPIVFPALEVTPLEDDGDLRAHMQAVPSFGLVIFVSPNAVDFALELRTTPWPAEVAIAVLGPGSVAQLASHGITADRVQILIPQTQADEPVRFDSESLERQIEATFAISGLAVLVVKGTGGRAWLIDTLRDKGAVVTTVESYRRSVGRPDSAAMRTVAGLIDGNERAQVIITSSESVEHLLELVAGIAGARGQQWLRNAQAVVPHPRIAENATAHGFADVLLAGAGDDAIVRAIE